MRKYLFGAIVLAGVISAPICSAAPGEGRQMIGPQPGSRAYMIWAQRHYEDLTAEGVSPELARKIVKRLDTDTESTCSQVARMLIDSAELERRGSNWGTGLNQTWAAQINNGLCDKR